MEEREPTMEDLRDPKTEDPRGSLPTSLISIGGIRHDIAARAASNLAFLGGKEVVYFWKICKEVESISDMVFEIIEIGYVFTFK